MTALQITRTYCRSSWFPSCRILSLSRSNTKVNECNSSRRDSIRAIWVSSNDRVAAVWMGGNYLRHSVGFRQGKRKDGTSRSHSRLLTRNSRGNRMTSLRWKSSSTQVSICATGNYSRKEWAWTHPIIWSNQRSICRCRWSILRRILSRRHHTNSKRKSRRALENTDA